MPAEILAEIIRSDYVEGHHRGSLIALSPTGEVLLSVGDPDHPMYPRSANKPLQAVGMLRAGLDVEGELLALAAASHSGEPFHVDGVCRILAGAALSEAALQNPKDWPLDEGVRLDFARVGGKPTRLHMNCSGKHAAMLATCVANGWETDTYREPSHPLQVALRRTVESLAGEKVSHVGVDGCGAPLFTLTLHGLARAYSRLALAEAGAPERRVADAIRAFPQWTSGTTRDEAALIRGVPGLVAKAGAECVYAVALADGTAVALKVDDGHPRARAVIMAAALREVGVKEAVLDEIGRYPVMGGDLPVGEIRAVL